MGDDYHERYTEITQLEKSINIKLNELQKTVDSKANSVKIEQDIRKKLSEYDKKRELLLSAHERNSGNLASKEEVRRRQIIHNLKLNLDRMKMKFEGLVKSKYGYQINEEKYENYQIDEQAQNMNNRELLEYQEKKIAKQDEKIDEIIGITKQGKVVAKEIKTNLEDQNKLLDNVEDGMDNLDSKMARTRKKFENYVAKSSTCCLTVVIILEVAALGGIIYWVIAG